MDYCSLVQRLLEDRKYPILKDFVIVDIYYKTIPLDLQPVATLRFDYRFDNPKDVYARDSRPFELSYMVATSGGTFCLNFIDRLPARLGPLQCIPVKLCRSFIDNHILGRSSRTFEEEIYQFIALLNFDVPRLASVLDMDFIASTRFLPCLLKLRVCHYATQEVPFQCPLSEEERGRFGPKEDEIIPIRMVSGRLSPCTSRSQILSLNNDLESQLTYLDHYVEQQGSVIPLAFNPLENPVIYGGRIL